MIILIILVVFWALIFVYEMWRAPLLEEQPDGSWKTIRPAKKLSDLWRKQ
jgi:hypothetical protein